MSPIIQILHALVQWAFEWIRMYLALGRIWIGQHPTETVIAFLFVALLFTAFISLPGSENQES